MLPKHLPTETSSQEDMAHDAIHGGEEITERIGPTRERLRQARAAGDDAVGEIVTASAVAVPRMLDGNVLELLLSRGVIDSEEHACGNDFYRHWYQSGLAANGVIDPARERVDGGEFKAASDISMWHQQKWQGMVRRLGQVHSHVMCDCVLMGMSLADFGLANCRTTSRRLAQERAKDRLVAALSQLVINELGHKEARQVSARGGADGADWITDPETNRAILLGDRSGS